MRLKTIIAPLLALVFILSGCNASQDRPEKSSKPKEVKPDRIIQIAKARIDDNIEYAKAIIEANPFDGSRVSYPYDKGELKYDSCSEDVKKLYDQMLPKILSFEPFTYSISEGYTYQDLDNVFLAWGEIAEDYPRVDLYFTIKEVFEEAKGMTLALEACYYRPEGPQIMDTAEYIQEDLDIFDAMCDLIVDGIDENWSTYDKYRYLALVITLQTIYDYASEAEAGVANGYNAIYGGLSICSGYSAAMEMLCEKANLYCETISGESENVSHAWNLAKLDSGTYHVDVTWCDAQEALYLETWDNYFMLTQEEIVLTHTVWDDVVATGTKYFVHRSEYPENDT